MKKVFENITLACGSLLFTFLVAETVLTFMPVVGVARTQELSADGNAFDVSSVRNGSVTYSDGWAMRNPLVKRTNNMGFFSKYDYEPGAQVVVAIGDSYTEAAQVEFEGTFHQRAATAIGVPVYNFGLSGAPLSQYEAYLAEACKRFRPTAAVFAIIHNDFDESFRAHRARSGFFHYSDTEPVTLEPTAYEISTLRKWVTKSSLVRYLFFNLHLRHHVRRMTSGSAEGHTVALSFSGSSNVDVAVSKRAIDVFLSRIDRHCLRKDQLVFLLDSDRQAIYRKFERRDEAMMYFRDRAIALGYRAIDLHPVFQANYEKEKTIFESANDPHWDRHGHKVIGTLLGAELNKPQYRLRVARQATQ